MVILVMNDHFHGIKSLFCPMEHKFPAVNKKCPQILLSKPVPLVGQLLLFYQGTSFSEHALKTFCLVSTSGPPEVSEFIPRTCRCTAGHGTCT